MKHTKSHVYIIPSASYRYTIHSPQITKALEQLDLLVVQELFLSATVEYAHVVLPGASFFEKNGTFTNGERRIQKVNQILNFVLNGYSVSMSCQAF